MTDAHCNTVYLSSALVRYRELYDKMRFELQAAGIDVRLIEGTCNVWARDYMPLQVGDHWVKFRYVKDFKTWPQLVVPDACWEHLGDVKRSDIILDGGNVVRHNEKVLMTEIVFPMNADRGRAALRADLKELLESEIIWLPVEPDDTLGHSDGVAAWIDDNTVFVNDYQTTWDPPLQDYGRRLRKALTSRGIECEPFPFAYNSHLISHMEFRRRYPAADDFAPAVGYSINFLHCDGIVLHPTFGTFRDEEAATLLKQAFPGTRIVGVDCRELAMEGGCTRCVSMAYAI